MDRLTNFQRLVPLRTQLYYRWRSLRWVPLRRKFFIGYDLDGNTYWEFNPDNSPRARRLFEPRTAQENVHSYFGMIPVAWVQWLRYARHSHPSLQDLANEELRVDRMRALAAARNQEQLWNKDIAEQRIQENLVEELNRVADQETRKVQGQPLDSQFTEHSPSHLTPEKDHNGPLDDSSPLVDPWSQSEDPVKPTSIKPASRN